MALRDSLKTRLVYTLVTLAFYRLLSAITLPGLNTEYGEGEKPEIMTIFSGGSKAHVSVVAVGIMPLVISILIFQTVQGFLPYLKKLNDLGIEAHRQKLNFQKWLTIGVALFSSYLYERRIENMYGYQDGYNGLIAKITNIVTLFVGFLLTALLANFINKRGVGNGVSMILITSLFTNVGYGFIKLTPEIGLTMTVLVVAIGIILAISGVLVLFSVRISDERNNHASKITSAIEFRALSSGATPMILTASVLAPLQYLVSTFTDKLNWDISYNTNILVALTIVLYYLFSMFWIRTNHDPIEIANELLLKGKSVQGVRPGWDTVRVVKLLSNITAITSTLIIASILTLPLLIDNIPYELYISTIGFSSVIFVPIITETVKDIINKKNLNEFTKGATTFKSSSNNK